MKARIVITGAFALALATLAFAQERPQPPGPRPADPLTDAEREKAVSIAREDGVHRGQLSKEKYSLVGVELVVLKDSAAKTAPEPDPAMRHASVLFYRADHNDGLQVLVDLNGGRVRESKTVRGESVPIGREEVERAAQIALRSDEVTKLLGAATDSFHVGIARSDEDNTIEGLRAVGADPQDPCTRQRCVDLFFRVHGNYVAGRRVTVNLSTSAVRVQSTKR